MENTKFVYYLITAIEKLNAYTVYWYSVKRMLNYNTVEKAYTTSIDIFTYNHFIKNTLCVYI